MLTNRINGLLIGASFVALLAGCSSPREPFHNRQERPDELCLNNYSQPAGNPQAAFREESRALRYVVQKGDTLWSISKRFLTQPWYWKQLWYDNPHIRNPHLIYPGDVLSVVTLNGQQRITMTEGASGYHGNDTGRVTKDGRAIYKYTPGVREYQLNTGPLSFAHSSIAPFLINAEVFSPAQIQGLPTVFGDAGDYLTLTQQHQIYTQHVPAGAQELSVYRIGNPLYDYRGGVPRTVSVTRDSHDDRHARSHKETVVLGYQMDYVGKVGVNGVDAGGLIKLDVLEAVQAMKEGDVLVPVNAHDVRDYFPKVPSPQCSRGYMVSNTNTQSISVKEFDTVITSFGRDNGAQTGDIWKIVRPGTQRVINGQPVQIPGKDIGYLMIIKVYDTFSMGFVLDSTQNIAITDWLVRP